MKLREKNEHLITKAADVLTFASQRMSELPGWEWLRVAIYGQGCRGTLCFVCQLWAAGSNWRQFDDFPFDTVGCKRFRLLKRLFEGSRAYRLEFLHSFDCKTLPVSTLELFSSFNSEGESEFIWHCLKLSWRLIVVNNIALKPIL